MLVLREVPRKGLALGAATWRVLASLLLAGTVLALAAAPASAHASLVSTDPADGEVVAAAPERVTLTFDEEVALVDEGVEVYDAAGDPIDVGVAVTVEVVTADLPGGLVDGTYTVEWRVIADDGHPVAGSFVFHVGAPSPTVVPPHDTPQTDDATMRSVVSVVQGLSYGALLLAGGLTLFLSWTSRGVHLTEEVQRRLVRILRTSVLVAITVAAVAVPLSGAYQRGAGLGGLLEGGSVDTDLVGDDLTVLLLQLVGLGLAAALAGRPTPSLTGDLGAALAVWSPALIGHTRAYRPESLLVLTDALHLSAGAVWLGGLVGLAVALPPLVGRERDAAVLLTRFSTSGGWLLVILVGTGTFVGGQVLDSWRGLVDTTYGRLLLVKAGLALVVVALAAWNRFGLLPRVSSDAPEARRTALHLVRAAALAEAAVLVVLLGVTGFLAEQPPRGDGTTGGTHVPGDLSRQQQPGAAPWAHGRGHRPRLARLGDRAGAGQ